MKQLRSAAFLSLIVLLIVLLSPSSSGQSNQPTRTPGVSQSQPQQPNVPATSGAAITSPAPLLDSAGQPPGPQLKIRLVAPRNQRKPLKPLPDTPLAPGILGQRVADSSQRDAPGQLLDPGILLKSSADSATCGSIVSYNFSPGANPQLQSVTTCTPRGWIATRRAEGKDKKPPAPLFQTTEYSAPRQ
jgi:hypothetical protein